MKTAGAILKNAREKQERSLAQVARQTRIKEKFLSALENCDWPGLPNFAVAQGFARSYAQIVDVNPSLVAALLRRDFPQEQPTNKYQEITLSPRSIWTPKATMLSVAFVSVLILGSYLVREYFLFSASPWLKVEKIEGDSQIIVVEGKTTPSATIEVNGKSILVNEDGGFKTELEKRDLISSLIEVQAVSRTGKKTVIQERVTN